MSRHFERRELQVFRDLLVRFARGHDEDPPEPRRPPAAPPEPPAPAGQKAGAMPQPEPERTAGKR